jgi:lipopolysaccharide/colanic/teichoic acid biosynthesis glycosyltransferase
MKNLAVEFRSESVSRPMVGILGGGYAPRYSDFGLRALNIVLSLVLIVCALPVFVIIGLLIVVNCGKPIFYKGVRLGIHKKPYVMYKFRTLPAGAQHTVGSDLLTHKYRMVSPFTRFLRDTRLDELPQLFNILKGDMDFVGPRPERPEVYEQVCKQIMDYDVRFSVKPGLIGYSQLFTPHSAPKRIRTILDNRLVSRRRTLRWEVSVILLSIILAIKELFIKGVSYLWWQINTRLRKKYSEKRSLVRLRPRGVKVYVGRLRGDEPSLGANQCQLIDLNEEALKIVSTEEIVEHDAQFILERNVRRSFRTKRKRAWCRSTICLKVENHQHAYTYVFKYEPISPLNQYMMDQYFLDKSFAW